MQTAPIRIATRGSALALWQAEAVRSALAQAHGLPPDRFAVVPIRTSGDRIQDRSLAAAGGKGLFSKEIEEALLAGTVDLAVHSAKDMETFLRPGLAIGAYLEREDVRDAWISRHGTALADLPEGARIGTASLRREALLRRVRPDLEIGLLRGNVPTRLAKIEVGAFDATLLAAAGLLRLGMEDRIDAYLDLDGFPPACGQGAVAVECRADDKVRDLLVAIDHRDTALAVSCERAFLAALDGSCRTPIAGYASLQDGRLSFKGVLFSPDGRQAFDAARSGPASTAAEAVALGREAGLEVRAGVPAELAAALGMG